MTARILDAIGLDTKLPPGAEQRIDLLADLQRRRTAPGLSRRKLAAIGDEYAALGCVRMANECYEAAGVAKRAKRPEPAKAVRPRRQGRTGPREDTIPRLRTALRLIANGATKADASRAVGIHPTNFKKLADQYSYLLEAQ